MYHTTAFLYDAVAAFQQPQAVAHQIHDLLLKGVQGEQPGALLDMGCGTGLMSILFAQKGWTVTGVDICAAMLDEARAKTATLPASVQNRLTWIEDDITHPQHLDNTQADAPSRRQADAIVCLCNTLNHLTPWPKAQAFIQHAYALLKPGGVLVLDTDVEQTFKQYFHFEPLVVWQDDHHRLTRMCQYDPTTGQAQHAALLEAWDGYDWHYQSQEAMPLQYHREDTLNQAFQTTGFTIPQILPFNPSPQVYTDHIPKALWVLQKPS